MDWMNETTVNYYVKYIHKTDEKHKEFEPIVLCSQGIGKGYIDKNKHRFKYKENESREYYKDSRGLIYNLPDYYKKKLYNEEERTKLWMQKLDKGVYRDWETDRKSTRLNSSHSAKSRMPSSA